MDYKKIITHALDLQRVTNQLSSDALKVVDKTLVDILNEWRQIDPGTTTPARLNRLKQLSEAWGIRVDDLYGMIEQDLYQELNELAQIEADHATNLIASNGAVRAKIGELGIGVNGVMISPSYVESVAKGEISEVGIPVRWNIRTGQPEGEPARQDGFEYLQNALPDIMPDGDTLAASFERLRGYTKSTLDQGIRSGLLQGQPPSEIVRNLMGLRGTGQRIGIGSPLKRVKDSLKSTVRTAATGVSAGATSAVVMANKEVTGESYEWLSTLDARTSPICLALDEQVFQVGKGPLPPAHRSCRSSIIPSLKGFYEKYGIEPDEEEERQNGFTGSAEEWLKSISFSELSEVLDSPTRAKMFLDGSLGVRDLVRTDGSFKTIEQLRAEQRLEKTKPADLESIMALGNQVIKDIWPPTISNMSKFLRSIAPPASEEEIQALTGKHITGVQSTASKSLLDKDIADFMKLTGGAMKQPITYVATGNRAYARLTQGVINLGPQYSKDILFHELGHFLEDQYPAINKLAHDFIQSKATSDTPQSLRKLTGKAFNENEMAYPDDFLNPYVGKTYGKPGQGPTEVISMALQYLTGPKAAAHLLRKAPDHFALIAGILKSSQDFKVSDQGGQRQGGSKPSRDIFAEPLFRRYERLSPEELRERARKQNREFAQYLEKEEQALRRRTSGEIDRLVKEYQNKGLAELRERLNIPAKAGEGGRKRISLRYDPITDKPDVSGLTPLTLSDDGPPLNEKEQKLVKISERFDSVLREIEEMDKKLPSKMRQPVYEAFYKKLDDIFAISRVTVTDARAALNNLDGVRPELADRIAAIGRVSKETLPGYKASMPTDELLKLAAITDC